MYISVSRDEEYEILKSAQALLKSKRPDAKLKLVKKEREQIELEVDIPIEEIAKILKAVVKNYAYDSFLVNEFLLLVYERKRLSVFSVKEPLRLSLIQKIESNINKKFSVERKREDFSFTTIVKDIDLRKTILNYIPDKEKLVEEFSDGRVIIAVSRQEIYVSRLEIYVSFNGKDSKLTYYGV